MKRRNLLFAIMVFCLPLLGTSALYAQGGVELEWVRAMGGTDADMGKFIKVDRWGNVYTTGYFKETVDFDPGAGTANLTSAGRDDIFVSKLDAAGNFCWARRMGGNDTDQNLSGDQGTSIAVDTMGNVYTTGYFTGEVDFHSGQGTAVNKKANGGWDVFLTKHDSSGKLLWTKTFGGKAYDISNAVAVRGGHVYVTGKFADTVVFDPANGAHELVAKGDDMFVCKMDLDGNMVWVKQVEITTGTALDIDAADNVLITGTFRGSVDFDPGPNNYYLTSTGLLSLSDVFVLKLNARGEFVWAGQVSGQQTDISSALSVDPYGNVLVTGRFSETADFDPGTGSFMMTSTFNTQIGIGIFSDGFLLKLDKDGRFCWARQIGGQQIDEGYGVYTDEAGNVYATGFFNGTITLDSFTLNATGGMWDADAYIVKLDSAGKYLWAKSVGGPAADYGYSITTQQGNVYTTGYFSATTDFDPGAGTHSLTAAGGNDIFVHKMICADTFAQRLTVAECDRYSYNGVEYTSSGMHVFRFVNGAGCDSSIYLDLTINHIEAPVVNVDEFELGTAGNYSSYQWLKNGELIPGATGNTYTVSENAGYSVIVTDENGCTDTSDTYAVSNVSIEHLAAAAVKVYPNPARDIIYVEAAGKLQLALVSLEGKVLHQFPGAHKADISGLSPGVYFLKVTDQSQHLLKVVKIVKQ